MNTLRDLRATLDQHAHLTDDADQLGLARVAAVRGRARRVRQRRAGTVVVGAVLAVVGIVLVPSLGGDRTPPVAAAPDTMTSLGWTYEQASTVSGRDRVTVRLPASDTPRLVSWGTAGAGQQVQVRTDGEVPRPSGAADWEDFAWIHPGGSQRVVLAPADGGELEVAVYELTDDAPEGVTVDGITYRERVGGERLLDAQIGQPGQDEVSVTYTVPAGNTRWAWWCTGGARDAWIHLDLGPEIGEFVSGPGCDDPTFDPGGVGGSSGPHGRTGETLSATLYLTDGQDGPRLDVDDDVRLGLGAYAVETPRTRVGGLEVPELVEHEGHLWELDGVDAARPGVTELDHTNSGGETQLVQAMSARAGRGLVDVDFPGPDGRIRLGGGGSTSGYLPPGDRVRITAKGGVPDRVRLAAASYGRVD